MARTFRGEFTQKVDNKGRVSIPHPFRRVIEQGDPTWTEGKPAEFVLVFGDARRDYLECYTLEAIEEVDAKIKAKPRGSMERQALERLFNSQSQTVSVDDTGRIVLSQKIRDKIGLTDEALYLGTGDTFRIWKPETSVEAAEQVESFLDWKYAEDPNFDVTMLLDV